APASTCADTQALLAPVEPPRPADAAAVAAARKDLDRAQALMQAGKAGAALTLARDATAPAQKHRYPPPFAPATLRHAPAPLTARGAAAPDDTFDDASIAAEEAHDDRLAAQARVEAIDLIDVTKRHVDASERAVRFARAAVARAGGGDDLTEDLELTWGLN